MENDIAVFLDLDNLVIGARQVNLTFDVSLVLNHVRTMTENGRIVLQRSYGDWRQNQQILEQITIAGFTHQTTVRLNNFSKNLADMQIVVDTMDTLVDGHQFSTYVLMTGDRDFTPLVQTLRKRGKRVIGVGVKHTTSNNLVTQCDNYVFYEDIIPTPKLTDVDVEKLLDQAIKALTVEEEMVRASVLKQKMLDISRGGFENTPYAEGSFRKFLLQFPNIVECVQQGTTTYVQMPKAAKPEVTLYEKYRTELKKRRLRIVPADVRFFVLRHMIFALLKKEEGIRWRQLIDMIIKQESDENALQLSKNMVNATMLVARKAEVIQTLKGKSLSTAPVLLNMNGTERPFQDAVMACDTLYLQEILGLPETFDIDEAARALYDDPTRSRYLKVLLRQISEQDGSGDAVE